MAVLYKSVPKSQPGVVGGGQIKYYASIVREQPVKLRRFAEDISEMSTLTTGDVFGVLELFMKRLNFYLEDGKIVKMGDFGSFSPSIGSSGSVSPEEINRNSITRYKINFRPSPILAERLSYVKFEKISNGISQEPIE
mgnify:CR=1 FL=1